MIGVLIAVRNQQQIEMISVEHSRQKYSIDGNVTVNWLRGGMEKNFAFNHKILIAGHLLSKKAAPRNPVELFVRYFYDF
jgi:hypothetical protein